MRRLIVFGSILLPMLVVVADAAFDRWQGPRFRAEWAGPAPEERRTVVGAQVEPAPVVRILDEAGMPLEGAPVRWEVSAGTAGPERSVTDSTGTATVRWVLGEEPGTQWLRAIGPRGAETRLEVVARVGSPAALVPAGIEVGDSSRLRVAVRVTDRFGNPVPTALVGWSLRSVDSAVVLDSSRTDSEGVAVVVWSVTPEPGDSARATLANDSTVSLVLGLAVPPDSVAPAVPAMQDSLPPALAPDSAPGGDRVPGPVMVWAQRMSGTPPARQGHSFVWDPASRVGWVFGGRGRSDRNDLWSWGSGGWEEAAAESDGPRPSPRRDHSAAPDGRRGFLLFGGRGEAGVLGDTWHWDGAAWSPVSTSGAPSERFGHAMAWDPGRSRVVLFGGQGPSDELLDDTWEWDGTRWRARNPGNGPAARVGHAVAFDAARGRMVLFGGLTGTGPAGDTWEWDGEVWREVTPDRSPPGRTGHVLVYDQDRQRVVLFGGQGTQGLLGDTWEWDGQRWVAVRVEETPSGRRSGGAIYDVRRGRLILYGGRGNRVHSDTWEYRLP